MEGITFSHYGELREVNANDEELQVISHLLELCKDLKICRKSDSYITAVLGETDVARFKYTQRAKWIQFPYTAGKVKLSSTSDVLGMADLVAEAVAEAEKINNY